MMPGWAPRWCGIRIGDQFTLADVCYAPFLQFLPTLEVTPGHPIATMRMRRDRRVGGHGQHDRVEAGPRWLAGEDPGADAGRKELPIWLEPDWFVRTSLGVSRIGRGRLQNVRSGG